MPPAFSDAWVRRAAPEGADLAGRGSRVARLMLSVIRPMTVAIALLLGLLSPDVQTLPLVLLAAVGFAETAWTARWLLRATVGDDDPRALGPLILDAALLMVAIGLSGGADSYVVFIVMVLPIAAAVVAGPRAIVVLGVVGIGGFGLVVGWGAELAVFAVEGVWAVIVAIAVGRQRGILLRRLAQIDDSVAALRAPGRQVRDGIGPELRTTVVAPIARVRQALRDPASPTSAVLHELADRVGAASVRVRSVVSELHAPSGRPRGLDGPLVDLVARRAPTARTHLAVGTARDRRFDALLVSIVRDALTVVATPDSTTVAIDVVPDGRGAVIRVVATPPPVRDPEDTDERHRVLALRVAGAGARLEVEDPARGVVVVKVRDLRAPDGEDPRTALAGVRGVRRVIAVCRMVGALAGFAVALIAGGNDPGWGLAGLAVIVVGAATTAVLVTRPIRAPVLLLLVAIDTIPIVWLWSVVGPDTQRFLLPIGMMLPVAWAFVAGPGLLLAIDVGIVGGLAAYHDLGPAGTPAALAGVWAASVGMVLATAGKILASQLRDAALRRNRSVQRMLEGEEGERRRLAADLHDDALQLLLAARQDLIEAADGDPDGAGLALQALDEADAALQYVLDELDLDDRAPLVEGGLRAALGQIATDVEARRRGPRIVLHVDPAAEGHRDGLIVRVARELLTNVVRHATATAAHVSVVSTPDGLRLEIADDGVGFDRRLVEDAAERGHVGLATIDERVQEAGGTTSLLDTDRGGALVRIDVPVPRAGVVHAATANGAAGVAVPGTAPPQDPAGGRA
ncbi:sensor histidine kinase [Patulibacter minatonensis]|uniref:sensor histidine kinase n=1 Tax=Patulibacter minatonensis TaxID=298163 RepID=UPI0006847175|nr:ATP-binding protein [Patulibacter minatonensis]